MRTVHAGIHGGPALGLAAQVGLLAALAGSLGLTATGWVVGVATGCTTNGLLLRALRRSGAATLGVANAVTLTRATLAGGVAALVASGGGRPAVVTTVVVLASVGLALDAVDGWAARRTRTATGVGARFDGEVDAFLILVLSVLVARSVGPWVLSIGLMRYAFLVAGAVPWMRAALPRRDWRKTVAAVQGVVLTVAAAGVLPAAWARTAVAVALLLLVESFGRDVVWLVRRRAAARPAHRRARAAHPVLRRATGLVAAGLLWVVLVAPDSRSALTPSAFLRIPVEALAIVAVAVVLPAPVGLLLAVLVGVALTGVTLVRALDMGFATTLDRPFDPMTDWQLLGPALGVVSDSTGLSRGAVGTGVTAAVVVLLVAVTWAVVRTTRLAARHRSGSLRAVAALGTVWALCATTAVTTASGAPVASASATGVVAAQVERVRTSLRDQRTFATEVTAPDRFVAPAAPRLLSGLEGKDVLLVFVESYGRVAVEGPAVSGPVHALLDEATASLQAEGFASRSAFLASPAFGGGSWLAHATLQSGLWIDSQHRYDELLRSDRLTLSAAFRRAGWRTVVDIPSSPSPWPEGQALHQYEVMYGTHDVGYAGPAFSYAQIPDQYTLHALHQRELAPRSRRPVMAEVDLVSSHAPWAPLPQMVPWQDLGDGQVFAPMVERGRSPAEVLRSAERMVAAYGESIRYSLTALVSYVQTFGDEDLVLVLLGDHQPTMDVTGSNPSHDVPITIVTQDRDVLGRTASWGWHDGMRPRPDAPVWRMDAFRDRFLSAFATPVGQAPPAGRAPPAGSPQPDGVAGRAGDGGG